MGFKDLLKNPCLKEKAFCINCSNQFTKIRPLIVDVIISKHFVRDLKDEQEVRSIVESILACSGLDFSELHKFELNVAGHLIFRARKKKVHIVYGIDKGMRIVFLRAIKNFVEYKKFLDDRKQMFRMIGRATGRSAKA